MCVTDRHDMTLAVKVALNLNTANQPTMDTDNHQILASDCLLSVHDRIDSDSSIDGELSYLDLDTGGLLQNKKTSDSAVLSTSQFDSILSKLSVLETCCGN